MDVVLIQFLIVNIKIIFLNLLKLEYIHNQDNINQERYKLYQLEKVYLKENKLILLIEVYINKKILIHKRIK